MNPNPATNGMSGIAIWAFSGLPFIVLVEAVILKLTGYQPTLKAALRFSFFLNVLSAILIFAIGFWIFSSALKKADVFSIMHIERLEPVIVYIVVTTLIETFIIAFKSGTSVGNAFLISFVLNTVSLVGMAAILISLAFAYIWLSGSPFPS